MYRRRFLAGAVHMLVATSLAACSDSSTIDSITHSAETPDPQSELALLLYDLFPYDGLNSALYLDAAGQIMSRGNPVIDEGLASLQEASGGRHWSELSQVERLQLLRDREDTAFFAALRAAAIENLYREPELWD